jgi:hypothetical protein
MLTNGVRETRGKFIVSIIDTGGELPQALLFLTLVA